MKGYADLKLVAAGELAVPSVNALELPGLGDYLIVTDFARKDHAFVVQPPNFQKVNMAPERTWQIAISFARADRKHAERLATALRDRGISVFYDYFEKANLWGKDLYQYLFDVYSKRSQHCLVLVSKDYIMSDWTKHELKAMQATALVTSNDYILPLRIDSTLIPGLPPQIGYVNYNSEPFEHIVDLICAKVKQHLTGPH